MSVSVSVWVRCAVEVLTLFFDQKPWPANRMHRATVLVHRPSTQYTYSAIFAVFNEKIGYTSQLNREVGNIFNIT